MQSIRERWDQLRRRYGISWRSWHASAALVALILLAFAWWALPRRIDAVILADEQQRWKTREAPPRREIVWQEPQTVALAASSEAALISPRLADGGNTLYFTRRAGSGQADIYRARRVDGSWQSPEPMSRWNTASDDIGPTFSSDGQTAYFYSNRPGGLGGFDLYLAEREGADWGAPRNLGASVNTPAHEYDPAPGSDGRLFFASNRTADMAAPKPAEPRQGAELNETPWAATLRAHPGLSQFDLYVTSRSSAGVDWAVPQSLAELNRAESNEGAPFSAGVFLYFASDRPVAPEVRPVRRNEAPNLDLYRARWNGKRFVDIENLGRGVNTAAHETEPGLSPEGYTLVFSSNRQGSDTLYQSTAQEVYHDVAWDDSNLRALSAIWWKALLLTLLFAAVIAAFLYSRGWLFEKASAARFFALSLLFHCLLLALMALVPLATVIIEMAEEIRVNNPATQLFDDNQHQSHEDGLEAYERLADLQSVDIQPLPEVARQETEPLNVPEMTSQPLLNLPTTVVRNVSPDRIEFVPVPQPEPLERVPVEIARETRVRPEALVQLDAVPAELLPAEQAPEEAPTEQPVAELARAAPVMQQPETDLLVRRAAAARPRMLAAAVEAALDVEVAPLPETPPLVAPAPRTPVAPDETPAESIELAEVPEAAPAVEMQPVRGAEVAVSRAIPAQSEPVRPAAEMPLAAAPRSAPRAVEVARLELGQAETLVTKSIALEVPRETQPQLNLATNAPTELPVSGAEAPAEPVPSSAPLQVERGAMQSPAAEVGAVPQQQQLPRRRVADLPTELALVETSAVRAETTLPMAPAPLPARPSAATPTDPEAPVERLAPVPGAEAASEQLASPAAAAVELARASQMRPAAAKPAEVPTPAAIAARMPVDDAAALRGVVSQPEAVLATVAADVSRLLAKEELPNDALAPQELAGVNAAEATTETPRLQAEIEVARQAAGAPLAGPETPEEPGGPRHRMESRLIVGALAAQRVDAPPSFDPVATRLQRMPARAKQVAFAEDNVGMQAMFTLRQGDTRREFIKLFGGTEATEAAVNSGLAWLAAHQNEEGSWSLHKHEGASVSDTAGTGFALLPFLAAGHTSTGGQYQPNVAKALKWLVDQQKPDGDLLAKSDNAGHHMYAHGVAAIALCEGYGMSQDPELKEPAQRAINFIAAAQHQATGGWRYQPNQPGDTSVVGWQVMALKSGEMAGLSVPAATLEGAKRWLASVEGNKPVGGYFGYVAPAASTAMTAEGLLCLQFMGLQRNDPRMRAGADFLLKNLPKAGVDTSYYWYYGTQMMYHMQGEYWETWNEATRDMLVNSQVKAGGNAGTWDPGDNWEKSGGRVFSTSLKLLMLEVYYRHLPLYQQLDD